jgi:hypothetical protein
MNSLSIFTSRRAWLACALVALLALLEAQTAAAQPPFPPGGPSIPARNPNNIVGRGGNAEVLLNTDGSVTMTSLGPGNDKATTTTVSESKLSKLANNPTRTIRVATTKDKYVTLYKLKTTGEYQVNIGPDKEGKVFVYIFTLDPRQCVRSYQFTKKDKTPQFSGGCS